MPKTVTIRANPSNSVTMELDSNSCDRISESLKEIEKELCIKIPSSEIRETIEFVNDDPEKRPLGRCFEIPPVVLKAPTELMQTSRMRNMYRLPNCIHTSCIGAIAYCAIKQTGAKIRYNNHISNRFIIEIISYAELVKHLQTFHIDNKEKIVRSAILHALNIWFAEVMTAGELNGKLLDLKAHKYNQMLKLINSVCS